MQLTHFQILKEQGLLAPLNQLEVLHPLRQMVLVVQVLVGSAVEQLKGVVKLPDPW